MKAVIDLTRRGHSFALVGVLDHPSGPLEFWECSACAALVSDRSTHRQWHRELEGAAAIPSAPSWRRALRR